MKLPDSSFGRKAQIPIVPLIDVVFLLLAAFVISTLSMTMIKGMPVDVPEAKGELNEKDLVLIVVSSENDISVGGVHMDVAGAAKAASDLSTERDLPIVIRGDKVSDLGHTIELIDHLRALGVKKLSFQVEEKR